MTTGRYFAKGRSCSTTLVGGKARGLFIAKKMVSSLNDILVDNGTSRALMNLMGSQEANEEFLMHSLNVCTLSILIARDLGLKQT